FSFCLFLNQVFLHLPGVNLKSGMTHVCERRNLLSRLPGCGAGEYNARMAEVPLLPGANRRELVPRRDYEQATLRAMLAALLLVALAAYALAVWFDWLPWLRGWG